MLNPHIRIGPRTIKTAAAVIISLIVHHRSDLLPSE